jgi:methyltransferase (TIGR00027 family)
MEANQGSKTAMGSAYIRAYHTAHVHPKIFDDFLADRLIPAEARLPLEDLFMAGFRLISPEQSALCPDRVSALAGYMQVGAAPPLVLGRSRYAEDHLEKAIDQGVRQYVILGAGFDTFAWRRPDLLEGLQVFEVDHPATQTLKQQLILGAGQEPPAQLHFVPVDFSRENLTAALRRTTYDPRTLSFFSWLGVSFYLSHQDLFATLGAIADVAPAGTSVVFDYLDTDAFVPEKVSRRLQVLQDGLRQIGEPMITGLDPASLAADLAPLGLRLQEDLAPADIEARYFQGRSDDYHACEHAHFAWVLVA